METIVMNFFGGPGTGKSTTCAEVFAYLKRHNINCEMALEYAKDKVWEKSSHVLDNQLYVFGKQYHRIKRLVGQVDFVLTDSPLLNSISYYEDTNPYFPQLVLEEHRRLDNLNFFLERSKQYNPAGRLQTEDKARELDTRIRKLLDDLEEPYHVYPTDPQAIPEIAEYALRFLYRSE